MATNSYLILQKAQFSWMTGPSISDSFTMGNAVGRGSKSGRISRFMKDTSKMIKQTVGEDSSIRMEMSMRVSGSMTRLTAKVYICIKMARRTQGSGSKICNMATGSRSGLTVPHMKGTNHILFSNYLRGKKNGQGKFIWPEKTVYIGEFRDNII